VPNTDFARDIDALRGEVALLKDQFQHLSTIVDQLVSALGRQVGTNGIPALERGGLDGGYSNQVAAKRQRTGGAANGASSSSSSSAPSFNYSSASAAAIPLPSLPSSPPSGSNVLEGLPLSAALASSSSMNASFIMPMTASGQILGIPHGQALTNSIEVLQDTLGKQNLRHKSPRNAQSQPQVQVQQQAPPQQRSDKGDGQPAEAGDSVPSGNPTTLSLGVFSDLGSIGSHSSDLSESDIRAILNRQNSSPLDASPAAAATTAAIASASTTVATMPMRMPTKEGAARERAKQIENQLEGVALEKVRPSRRKDS
jgi:hypothetical protein